MVMTVASPRKSINTVFQKAGVCGFGESSQKRRKYDIRDDDDDDDDDEETMEMMQIGAEKTKNVLILMSDIGGGHSRLLQIGVWGRISDNQRLLSSIPSRRLNSSKLVENNTFEVWLDSGSQHKKPPEQLPIVLWILSVGNFPCVLKLLKTPAADLRQSLVFIWTKILAFDKVDLVKDGGHFYFIKFLDSIDACPKQRAMTTFVLTVIVDGHRQGHEAYVNTDIIHLCLRYLQSNDVQTEPLLLQWLCLCLEKLCEDCPKAQVIALRADALKLHALLSDPQPEVRASATFVKIGVKLVKKFRTTRRRRMKLV
ncbi:hypothetical protein CsSME_00007947 [Camellia sinensis var. sinensis]